MTAAYGAALHATVNHLPSRPHRYWEQLGVGAEVGLLGLLAGEVLLGFTAVYIVRRGGTVNLPGGLPITGRWFKFAFRASVWAGPGLAGAFSATLFHQTATLPNVSLLQRCRVGGHPGAACPDLACAGRVGAQPTG